MDRVWQLEGIFQGWTEKLKCFIQKLTELKTTLMRKAHKTREFPGKISELILTLIIKKSIM